MNKKRLTLIIVSIVSSFSVWYLFFNQASEATELLYTVKRTDFAITVEAGGLLQAKNGVSISTPRIRWTVPTINYLLPEGSRVKKGDLVVELEAGEVERNHLTALDELAIAKADAEKGEAELQMERQSLQSQMRETEASLQAAKLQLKKLDFEPWRTQEITRLKIASDSVDVTRIRQKLTALEQIHKEVIIEVNLMPENRFIPLAFITRTDHCLSMKNSGFKPEVSIILP